MNLLRLCQCAVFGGLLASLSACGGGIGSGNFSGGAGGGLFSGDHRAANAAAKAKEPKRSTIWDLFNNADNPNTTLEVNRYLWVASLDVLNFLPIESVDPFSGVIVTGYGTPPGGGRAYSATIYVQDPALDARSLKVALQSKGGAVDPATVRAVEDAILTRARQLRVQDGKL